MALEELFVAIRETACVLGAEERTSLFTCLLVDAVARDRTLTLDELLGNVFAGYDNHPLNRQLGQLELVVDNAGEPS